MVISVIVLYAGVTSLIESVKKIITPETPEYTATNANCSAYLNQPATSDFTGILEEAAVT